MHSLFWFLEANGIDKIALKHLTGSKDIDKALSDFEKGCRGFEISSDSYSAILNYSTLQIIAYSQHKDFDKLKSAIAYKFDIVTNTATLALLKDLGGCRWYEYRCSKNTKIGNSKAERVVTGTYTF